MRYVPGVARLRELFSIPLDQRDKAVAALTEARYDILDVEDAGGERDRRDEYWAVIVVRSTDEVDDPTNSVRQAFAEAIGDVLDAADVGPWRLVSPPSRPRARPAES
jgi:hypothetical protein